MIGILQYIAPTLQFLLGVLVFGEPSHQPAWSVSALSGLLTALLCESYLVRRRMTLPAVAA